ncbi:hypothetical protein GQ55_7G309300 [Panicum hallii var. hallii]|uniref:Uncharacterized protein n=1 Tax=Panicum hallii var. hallii TaxID=1504633 RepID=A0A2T7D0V1_9POAL|nr:hypothetical protein GQ55_7G309300 [Panicum hallii var. hallii]
MGSTVSLIHRRSGRECGFDPGSDAGTRYATAPAAAVVTHDLHDGLRLCTAYD